jgi:hypothetical protein
MADVEGGGDRDRQAAGSLLYLKKRGLKVQGRGLYLEGRGLYLAGRGLYLEGRPPVPQRERLEDPRERLADRRERAVPRRESPVPRRESLQNGRERLSPQAVGRANTMYGSTSRIRRRKTSGWTNSACGDETATGTVAQTLRGRVSDPFQPL